jgi:small subunit ribosomal protein S20
MPQRKSAKRELKKSLKRRRQNLARKKAIKEAIKTYQKALKAKDLEGAKTALNQVYKVLDKAASKKVIHPNKAARKKSRFTSILKNLKTEN